MSRATPHWLSFTDNPDPRGRLTAIESGKHLPFDVKRVFYLHQITQVRGGHAHVDSEQVIVPVHGRLTIDITDGVETMIYHLDDPAKGVFLPRMMWIRLYDFTPDAVCLVLTNTLFDPNESIRSWDRFLATRGIPYYDDPGPAAWKKQS